MLWGGIAGGGTLKANFHESTEYWPHRATAHPKPGIILPTLRRVHHKLWLCVAPVKNIRPFPSLSAERGRLDIAVDNYSPALIIQV
jgi:hypothetical protein